MSELTRRVLFAVVAAPVAVAIVLYGGAPLAAILAILAALGAWEFFRIARAAGHEPLDDLGIALAGIVPLAVHARYLQLYEVPLSFVMLAVLVLFALTIWMRGVARRPLGAVSTTVFGVLYTGGMFAFGYAIRHHQYAFGDSSLSLGGYALPSGGLLLLLPLLLTWVSDIGAYVVGRSLGKRKLIPAVSPGKTIAGAVGAVVCCALFSWAYARWLLAPATQLGFVTGGAIAFGILVSVAAQIGDLAESLLKREAGVKDSSRIIPGHGGVLDRFDSVLFVFPFAYVLLNALLTFAPAGR